MRIIISICILGCILSCMGCESEPSNPKPRVFPRVEYPSGRLIPFSNENCPFQFVYPDYCTIRQDDKFAKLNPPHPCWFNIQYPMFNAEIYCSYLPIDSRKEFEALRADAFEIIDQVNKRSDYMEEIRFQNAHQTAGIIFDFKGPAASPIQLYMSDTSQHFFKAALYFNTKVKPDSLLPIRDFIASDITEMLESFRWNY